MPVGRIISTGGVQRLLPPWGAQVAAGVGRGSGLGSWFVGDLESGDVLGDILAGSGMCSRSSVSLSS